MIFSEEHSDPFRSLHLRWMVLILVYLLQTLTPLEIESRYLKGRQDLLFDSLKKDAHFSFCMPFSNISKPVNNVVHTAEHMAALSAQNSASSIMLAAAAVDGILCRLAMGNLVCKNLLHWPSA